MPEPVLYVTVSKELRERIEGELVDPVTKSVPYGALSHLVRQLLVKWLEERNGEVVPD